MRSLGLAVVASVAACTKPNPAWLLTESASSGASSEGTEGPGTTGAASEATTEWTSTAAVTTGVPETGEPATATTSEPGSTGEPGTTGMNACVLPAAADLELIYTADDPAGCDPQQPRELLVEVLGESGDNQWKFNVCADEDACVSDGDGCEDGEHVIFTFEGPLELVPEFVPGECHQVHLLARGPVDGEPNSCLLRVLRFAHTGYAPFAMHYFGATAVPGTEGLPGMVDWLGVLGFEVASKIAEPCADDPLNCQPPVGSYQLAVKWGMPAIEYMIAEGESFNEQIKTTQGGQEVAIMGAFTDVRSRIELGQCGARQDFEWVWLAPLFGP